MSTRPAAQSKAPTNGAQQRGGERMGVSSKAQSVKSQSANTAGISEKSLRDRVAYLTTSQIGHTVEAHLKNGSVYRGIFHAVDGEKGFGIILKMACLIKDGALRGHESRYEIPRKEPAITFIIPADELVQVVAKDLSVSRDNKLKAVQSEKPTELLTDSSISRSHHGHEVRELKPWVPHDDVPQRPDMENVFNNPTDRADWDQFDANESQFGVKSTFNEEHYTTQIDRGPHTKGLEDKAQRIAREIEGETTRDLHVAEERGHQLSLKSDRDEETKYSSVRPVDGVDDSGFDEEDDTLLDSCNDQTFGGASTSDGQKPASSSKGDEELLGDSQSSRKNTNVDPSRSISDDHARQPPSEQRSKDFALTQSAEESVTGHGDINEGAKSGGDATSASKAAAAAERERQVSQVSGKTKCESSLAQSASGSLESHPARSTTSRPGLSPSSSIGSLSSSEKSTLNPDAKEFKLNPNATSYRPSQPVRPQPSVPELPYYYSAPGHVQQMPGVPPVGYAMAPQYPGQRPEVLYPHPQTYYPPNAAAGQYMQQQQIIHNQPPAYLPHPPNMHNQPPAYPPPPPHHQQDMP